jgi:hypothetical protein
MEEDAEVAIVDSRIQAAVRALDAALREGAERGLEVTLLTRRQRLRTRAGTALAARVTVRRS